MKNIVSVCSHNTSAYFHRTTLLLISLVIVFFSVSAFAGRSCSAKRATCHGASVCHILVLDAIDISDGVHE